MVDFRKDNKYFLSFSDKFLVDFELDRDIFLNSIRKYIFDFYLNFKPQFYSVKIWESIVKFHKVDAEENNKSKQKAKRIIIFIVLNSPDWKNTVFPAFAFSTQEEKIYNKKLKNAEFVKTLRKKLEKYNLNNENIIEL